MLRLSSVTHAFNMSQYISELSFWPATGGGGLNAEAPSAAAVKAPTPTVAPPGPYMLFILNRSGVPSDAKIVQLAELESIAVTPANPTIQTGGDETVCGNGDLLERQNAGYYDPGDLESSTAVATIHSMEVGWPRACPLATLPYPRNCHCPGP